VTGADKMGTGKTPQTIATLCGLYRGGSICNALIVVPSSVAENWEVEGQTWLEHVPGVKIINICQVAVDKRRKVLLSALKWYEIFLLC